MGKEERHANVEGKEIKPVIRSARIMLTQGGKKKLLRKSQMRGGQAPLRARGKDGGRSKKSGRDKGALLPTGKNTNGAARNEKKKMFH